MSPSASDKPELVVIREAGGLGDLVRIFAVLDALAGQYAPVTTSRLVVMVPRVFDKLMELCLSISQGRWEVVLVDPRNRRKPSGTAISRWGEVRAPYLRVISCDPRTPVVDLFCPALRHELDTAGRVTQDRLECWARQAGVWPLKPGAVRLAIPEAMLAAARAWRGPGTVVGVSAKSNAAIRTWRNGVVEGRRTGRMGHLIELLRRRGWRVALFGRQDAPADLLSLDEDIRVQAARLAVCDLFIGPDSGMLHVACAAGVPAVGIFGPTDGEAVLRCYSNPRRIVSGRWSSQIRSQVGCNHPCYGFSHAGFQRHKCSGSCRVLESVAEESVVSAAAALIEHPRSLLV